MAVPLALVLSSAHPETRVVPVAMTAPFAGVSITTLGSGVGTTIEMEPLTAEVGPFEAAVKV